MNTKNRIWLCVLIGFGLALILDQSCKKDVFNPPYMTDHDGNVYTSVTIGTQEWMVENLKTTKYNDGSAIPLVRGSLAWKRLTSPGYCWYGNNEAKYKTAYGALYNWYVVDTVRNGGKNVCPTGWHVPSIEEWYILFDYLGGDGGKLKETGTSHWISTNSGATNESGFTALPSGTRNGIGDFVNLHSYGYWWSSTDYSLPNACYWLMDCFSNNVSPSDRDKKDGSSVRCLKD